MALFPLALKKSINRTFVHFHFLKAIFCFAVKASMPLKKGSSFSLPADGAKDQTHPLKRKQPLSFDDRTNSFVASSDAKPDVTKNRLIRSNDLLTQTSTEVLLDLLKAYTGEILYEFVQLVLYPHALFGTQLATRSPTRSRSLLIIFSVLKRCQGMLG